MQICMAKVDLDANWPDITFCLVSADAPSLIVDLTSLIFLKDSLFKHLHPFRQEA